MDDTEKTKDVDVKPPYPKSTPANKGDWLVWHKDGSGNIVAINFPQGSPGAEATLRLPYRQQVTNIGKFHYDGLDANGSIVPHPLYPDMERSLVSSAEPGRPYPIIQVN